MKNILCIIIFLFSWVGFWFSAQWYLPWIDLITRDERWAKESIWWRNWWSYWWNEAYQKWLEEWWENEEFEKKKANQERQAARTSFMVNRYPQDIAVDKTIKKIWNNTLRRPITTVNQKTKIIIHHTADSFTYDWLASVDEAMDHFHEFHTLTRWRWDIWYNFLIDPFGRIFEWRQWWQGAVWAHSDWNNSSTLWISLMWNFDKDEPSKAMMRSLVKLSVTLWYYYGIWPGKKTNYYTAISQEPYISVSTHDVIAGHQDTKLTACPWEYVYEKIPSVRKQVRARMEWLSMHWVKILTDSMFRTREQPFVLEGNSWVVWFHSRNESNNVSCTLFGETSTALSCHKVWNKIIVNTSYEWIWSSGIYTLWIKQWSDISFVEYWILWSDQLEKKLTEKKRNRSNNNTLEKTISQKKSVSIIRTNEARSRAEKSLSVLLYELTSEYDRWELRCEWTCLAIVNWQRFPNPSIVDVVRWDDGTLTAYIDQQSYDIQTFGMTSPWLITIENYERNQEGFPLNTFKWSLTFTKSKRNHLEQGEKEWWVMINTISFDDYLLWIWEWSELQHTEKLKTLVILSKQYALWYAAWENIHPSIPDGVWYTAIDDPRMFQRYIWAWREAYAPKWSQAVNEVKHKIVSYNNLLPILPYFHCSWWFTRSWSEKWWWKDTPWLQSVIDPITCESWLFEGHWVWLSGDWAEALANAWVLMEDILWRYYNGIVVE